MNTAQFDSLAAMAASCFVVGYAWLALLWVAGIRRRWPHLAYGSAALAAFLFGMLAVGDPATRGLVALLALVGVALYVCLVKLRRLQTRVEALETTVRRWAALR